MIFGQGVCSKGLSVSLWGVSQGTGFSGLSAQKAPTTSVFAAIVPSTIRGLALLDEILLANTFTILGQVWDILCTDIYWLSN